MWSTSYKDLKERYFKFFLAPFKINSLDIRLYIYLKHRLLILFSLLKDSAFIYPPFIYIITIFKDYFIIGFL